MISHFFTAPSRFCLLFYDISVNDFPIVGGMDVTVFSMERSINILGVKSFLIFF